MHYWLGIVKRHATNGWPFGLRYSFYVSHAAYRLILKSSQVASTIGKIILDAIQWRKFIQHACPDSKVHGANMGPTWALPAPDVSHIVPWTLLSGMIRVHGVLCELPYCDAPYLYCSVPLTLDHKSSLCGRKLLLLLGGIFIYAFKFCHSMIILFVFVLLEGIFYKLRLSKILWSVSPNAP